MDMMNECGCDFENVVSLPVRGKTVDIDVSALNLLSEDRVREIFNELSIGSSVKPNLKPGEEVFWPATYDGKQVYATLVDFGSMPNKTSKSIQHGIEDVEWITVSTDYSQVIGAAGTYLPIAYPNISNVTSSWSWSVTDTLVAMSAGTDRRAYNARLCLLYTKTTDPVVA